MQERENIGPAIYDPIPTYLEQLSQTLYNRRERMPLVAEEYKVISLNEELSRLVHSAATIAAAKEQRVNEYIDSVAVMHHILQDHIVGGYPVISASTIKRIGDRDLSIVSYESELPNLMKWVNKESANTSNQIQARHGFMSTFALAYKELHPPKPTFFARFRKQS